MTPLSLRLSAQIVLALWGIALRSQAVEIKIVDGRNGRPIADKCMNVWVGNRSNPQSGPLLETQTDANGIIRLRLVDEDGRLGAESQRLACGSQGIIDPVVKYGDTISIRTGYGSCQPHVRDYSWLTLRGLTTRQVIEQGIVMPNACGKATASPTPREATIFVRPLTWWEKLKQ